MTYINSKGKSKAENGEKGLKHFQSVLNRYCLSLTHSKWDAEDLAQDTWIKAIGSSKSLGHKNPEALLLRIAKNTWIDESRRKNILNRILKKEQSKVTFQEDEFCEIELILLALVKHLSPLQRTVFLLREVFKFSIMEAAAILNTTDGAVKAALYRARQAMDSVREDLENDLISLPGSKEMQAYISAFSYAYRIGDIAGLVELSRQNIVYKLYQNNLSKQRIDSSKTLQMVA